MPKRNKNKNYNNNHHQNNNFKHQNGGGVNQKWSKKYNKNNRQIYLKPSQLGAFDNNDTEFNTDRHNKRDKNRVVEDLRKMGVVKTKLSIGDTDQDIKKNLLESKPHCQLRHMTDDVFKLIVDFIQKYFTCYDSNREGLLAAYNPKVNFSLCLNLSNQSTHRSFKFDEVYFKDNRNLKRLCGREDYHHEKKFKLLHQGYIDTVNFMSKLPPTEHQPSSFKLDSCSFMPNMISFAVSGVFKEGKPTDKVRPLRSFNRSFVCIPDATTQISIVNEQFIISHITVDQYKKYFEENQRTERIQETPVQTQPVQDLSLDTKNAMVQTFSTESKLNLEWSRHCLEHANWNYQEAAKAFMDVKDSIPREAFLV